MSAGGPMVDGQEAGNGSVEEVRFGGYEARFSRCAAPRGLVIALTGVGNTSAPLASYEFAGSLARRPVDTLLIRDQLRSWYNAPEGWAALLGWLTGRLAGRDYGHVTILGVSMGAYGALLLGEALPRARVVAMSPPISVDLEGEGQVAIRHRRWIHDHGMRGLDRLAPRRPEPGRHLILFGDAAMLDLRNAWRFVEEGWPGVALVRDGLHNLPQTLKTERRFEGFIDALATGAPLPALLAEAGAAPAHRDSPAFRLLHARAALFAGDRAGAAAELATAARGLDGGSLQLGQLRLLRAGVEGALDEAMALLRDGAGQRLSLSLDEGIEASLASSEVKRTSAGIRLGPVSRLSLRAGAGGGPRRLVLHGLPPPAFNAGGSTALTLYHWSAAGPGARWTANERHWLEVPELPLGEGAAEFLLHRPCFGSSFDRREGAEQFAFLVFLHTLTCTAAGAATPPGPATERLT